MNPIKTYLIIPDLHCPSHDIHYLKLISKIIQKVQPCGLVQLGDALDFFQISKYLSDPIRKNTICDDILTYKEIIYNWESILPKEAIIHQLCGNHENRLTKYIWSNAREISGAVKSVPEMIGMSKQKLKWYPLSDYKACRIGDAILHHGHYFNQHVAMTNLMKYRTNFICGHTHRVQYVSDGNFYSATLGHGSNEDETAHQPTPTGWQQAFALLHVLKTGKSFLNLYLVNNGKVVLDGDVISA